MPGLTLAGSHTVKGFEDWPTKAWYTDIAKRNRDMERGEAVRPLTASARAPVERVRSGEQKRLCASTASSLHAFCFL